MERRSNIRLPISDDILNPLSIKAVKSPSKKAVATRHVLNPFHSRTRCAPLSSEPGILPPSTRIGSFLSPEASNFTLDLESRAVTETNYIPFNNYDFNQEYHELSDELLEFEHQYHKDPKNLSKRNRTIHKSIKNYNACLETLSEADISAFKKEWKAGFERRLGEEIDAGEMEAIEESFQTAMKSSILNYILINPDERKRLGVALNPCLERRWGNPKKVFSGTNSSRQKIQESWLSLNNNMYTYTPASLQLLDLFSRYSHFRLFLKPDLSELPLSPKKFTQMQIAHIESVKEIFHNEWHPQAMAIFQKFSQEFNFDPESQQTLQFLEAASTLMQIQLTSIVYDSISELLIWLRKFRDSPSVSLDDNAPADAVIKVKKPEGKGLPPLFVLPFSIVDYSIHVTIGKDNVKLGQITSMMIEILDAICVSLSQLPRIETVLFPEEESNMKINICVDTSTHDETTREITEIFNASIDRAQSVIDQYRQNMFLFDDHHGLKVSLKQDGSLKHLRSQIEHYREFEQSILTSSSPFYRVSLFRFDARNLNSSFSNECRKLVNIVKDFLRNRNKELSYSAIDDFKKASQVLRTQPTDSEALVQLINYTKQFKRVKLRQLNSQCSKIRVELDFLFNSDFLVDKECLAWIGEVAKWKKQIEGDIIYALNQADLERKKLEAAFFKRLNGFEASLGNLESRVAAYKKKSDLGIAKKNLKDLSMIEVELQECELERERIEEQENLLNLPASDLTKLEDVMQALGPFLSLWKLVNRFKEEMESWENGPIFQLEYEQVENNLNEMFRGAFKLSTKELEESAEGAIEASKSVKETLDKFKKKLPLVQVLCNKGMRKRHWVKLSEVVGYQVEPNEVQSLNYFLEKDMLDHIEPLAEIAECATKENNIEKSLREMRAEWDDIEFEVLEYKETKTFVLSGDSAEVLEQALDDHIVKTQSVKSSPFAEFIRDEILQWEEFLLLCQDTKDCWLRVQQSWMYLEPIFTSGDIRKQLPDEASKFQKVDNAWRSILSQVHDHPKAKRVIGIPNLLEDFKGMCEKLEYIQKGLNQYLDTKRIYFPRFFFLSADELLAILADCKNPENAQPHIKKCFTFTKIKFDDSNNLLAMISSEKENVPLCNPIDTNKAEGAVEIWFKQLEGEMRNSVKQFIITALEDHSQRSRGEWLAKHPGQAVLTVNSIFWTRNVEAAITKQNGLKEYHQKLVSELADVVTMVRGKLPKALRKVLKSLVVIDVHNRDVVQSLIDNEIDNAMDFDWTSQLRYYWEDDTCKVRICDSTQEFGYEYLGIGSRLVITPLTDRCYRTLMAALELDLGGAPEGPAGTGKTETVKDLAKNLAITCVVFNCSDGLDYKAMGKFFKGLAACGAWACFDEFNRIDLEVLSVIAQQIITIQRAVRARVNEFEFEGTILPLRHTCAAFITMNPGYAGRSELPDNLKVLFRTVAMMVPDYAMIAEIFLMSLGYSDAKNLARKIVQTYRLCSEQLSSQDHYDYGMRAVMAVLSMAGNLKLSFPEEKEDILMLRAINDVNLPKFLEFDVPLFQGIISDLFPGVEPDPPDYEMVLNYLRENLDRLNLQHEDIFITKILQIWEMMKIRHGFMVVGLPFSGKTKGITILKNTLIDMHKAGIEDSLPVKITTINPKAVTMNQLYGMTDPITQEWKEGVLSTKYRDFSYEESEIRKWLIFDGPVDAIWIENMNTVLDNNMKLCLTSGEIIPMNDMMSIMFETRDLSVASPATVSRCGMIYLEPQQLGYDCLFVSWLKELPAELKKNEDFVNQIKDIYKWLMKPSLKYLRSRLEEFSPTQDANLVFSFMNLIDAIIKPIFIEGNVEKLGFKKVSIKLEMACMFAFIWSVGASTKNREQFDTFLRELMDETDKYSLKQALPRTGLVYDYRIDFEADKWVTWKSCLAKIDIPTNAKAEKIVIPTVDQARYSWLFNALVQNNFHSLFVGPTGTGKTTYISDKIGSLCGGVDAKFSHIPLTFSAQTTASQTQGLIDEKLTKRKKGHYGPPWGKRMILFVDDLNMPAREEYGAQPPIELLRQMIDQGGWYDLDPIMFHHLDDITVVAAMGPPGGGRNPVTDRFLRHFNVISVCQFDDDTLKLIFSSILSWHIQVQELSNDILKMLDGTIDATLRLYNKCRTELLATPTKSHYTYNLRDFAKVIQGLCLSNQIGIVDVPQWIRLWTHESFRVFGDRLINDTDISELIGWITNITKNSFGKDFNEVCKRLDSNGDGKVNTPEELRGLMFGFYMDKRGKTYTEVEDVNEMRIRWKQCLDEYNQISNKPMNIVLFQFALEHASRVARVLRLPQGNALLIGVGGSGKQSLTALSSYMCGYEVMTIELTKTYSTIDWHADLIKILKAAGTKDTPVTFLLTDTQIKEESFLEDVNSILNSGEVPNLFPPEEKAEILELISKKAAKEGRTDMWNFFIDQVRASLHLVICMSPLGDALRTRLRMFPSLINCCTVDWFQAWPEDALDTVAVEFLESVDLDESVKSIISELCVYFHASATELSTQFWKELQRQVYITPTSYLQLIQNFKSLLGEQTERIRTLQKRYGNGLKQLKDTGENVKKMKQTLIELQPVLVQATKDTEEKIVKVDKESIEAEAMAQEVAKEEEIAQRAAAEAKAISDECEKDLAEAIPILEEALAALKTLTKNDLNTVKAFATPPGPVKLTLKCVCIYLDIKGEKKRDPATGKTELDYWGPSKKIVLSDAGKLLKTLESYDKDNIPTKVVNRIRKEFLDDPDFQKDRVKTCSNAAYGLCCWCWAMVEYDRVAKIVAPKRIQLAEAQETYDGAKIRLDDAQARLKVVQDRVDALKRDLKQAEDKMNQLKEETELTKVKLERAEKLMAGLGGEKDRWGVIAIDLEKQFKNISGDTILSAGVIAYLGPFTAVFRQRGLAMWVKKCEELELPCSGENYMLSQCFGNPVEIREWLIDGLPNDNFSIDNAIILQKSSRYPLFIDPEQQGNQWIRNMEKKNKLHIVKQSDADFSRKIKNCISFGLPALLEDVGEDLDPSLESVLLKQTFKSGAAVKIKFGDEELDFDSSFRLYLTTKLRNPHYMPEIATKVQLINFMITPEGLQDQILGIVVARERPDLEKQKNELIVESANNKRKLKEIEDEILKILDECENILEDEAAIKVLSQSKVVSNQIAEQQKVAEETEKKIDAARNSYKPVSHKASVLFFCISDLSKIDSMYQYSLEFFVQLFEMAIRDSGKSNVLETRLKLLMEYFTYSLYSNICRSLFVKDKLLFSYLLTVRLMLSHEEIKSDSFSFFCTGNTLMEIPANPAPEWLSDRSWADLFCASTTLDDFKGLHDDISTNPDMWREFCDAVLPHKEEFPGRWASVSDFIKLTIVRCLRPDKCEPAIVDFVGNYLGAEFTKPPPFDLKLSYNDSTPITPLIFVLSPGSDPMAALMQFAQEMNMAEKVTIISLGQGQGARAQAAITKGFDEGEWVVLQNCHLYVSWMATLEQICSQWKRDYAHENFRLWLTSYPSPAFPSSILQNGLKMTNEPPKGLAANIYGSYAGPVSGDMELYQTCRRGPEFRKLLASLCFFHGVLQERRNFGSLGWNIPYEFNDSDLDISIKQLFKYCNQSGEIPYKAIRYMFGECNYGGRVTDAVDRRTLNTILMKYICPEVLKEGYHLSPGDAYVLPEDRTFQDYIDWAENLPAVSESSTFGLHSNADITRNIKSVTTLIDSILLTLARSVGGSGKSEEEKLQDIADDILSRLRKPFNVDKLQAKFPTRYDESMNTVFIQEINRVNRLLSRIRTTLENLRKAIKGLVVMSGDLEKMSQSMINGKVPKLWKEVSYPSLKPLGSYVNDLIDRVKFFEDWAANGPPCCFWISGFFFTQAFLTGVRQNYARKSKIAIDQIDFDFEVIRNDTQIISHPPDGAYVRGLFLDGARWDDDAQILVESNKGELFSQAPRILLKPLNIEEFSEYPNYDCPVYKESTRRGMLSTTGHSTNYVMNIRLPSDKPPDHWIMRGVALLTQLDD